MNIATKLVGTDQVTGEIVIQVIVDNFATPAEAGARMFELVAEYVNETGNAVLTTRA